MYGGVTQTCVFLRWYKRVLHAHPTKCQMLAIETIADGFGPRGHPGLAPYDVLDVSSIHDIVCVRPNKQPRADLPDSVFLVNRFILKDARQLTFERDLGV